jgi:hypothetical protein
MSQILPRNGNQGSILAYSCFGLFLVTGLIGALLTPYFLIPCIWALNPKLPLLRGGKPALLFPIGWQIVVQMGWSRGNERKRPVMGVSGFRAGLLSLLGETGEIIVIRQKMEKDYEILFNSRHIMLLRLSWHHHQSLVRFKPYLVN